MISGLRYRTLSHAGMTWWNGTYDYYDTTAHMIDFRLSFADLLCCSRRWREDLIAFAPSMISICFSGPDVVVDTFWLVTQE